MDIMPVNRISVDRVSKQFNLGFKKNENALGRVLSLVSSQEAHKTLSVLQDISFSAAAGENIGLIGRNGSGKSTLLRLIAGIYQADAGTINARGEIVYLNGFSSGLRDRLTMRENIYLVGLLMGLSRKEIDLRFGDIVAFAELENFIDTKVYQFSSGMMSRLSFAITFQCLRQKRPDIILFDEVFSAGGDLAFQKKALAQMEEFIRNGTTVLLVNHNLGLIEKYCQRSILLERGRIIEDGPTAAVAKHYLELINGR
ncbi:MAG: ABC transporter ATP-binding protein [Patescibacteria group bacterium]